MQSAIATLGNLLLGMSMTVGKTLLHNGWVLAFSIVTAVVLKTYVNTEKLKRFLVGRTKVSILLSVAVGAFTPFCACGTMAVIVGMMTTALPWGPIMAFLTSSPLMSPDGFVMLAGLISVRFAVALTLASLLIGLGSGWIAQWIERHTGFLHDQTRYRKETESAPCGCAEPAPSTEVKPADLQPVYYQDTCGCPPGTPVLETGGAACCAAAAGHRGETASRFFEKIQARTLLRNLVDLGFRQVLLYFSLFVAVGYLINELVPASIVSALFGANTLAATPLAALIGLPLYLTTESSIPLINSLLQSGANEGAMLAFIISGSATSAWVIAGLTTFMKKKALGLYVACILTGSILAGYLYDAVLALL